MNWWRRLLRRDRMEAQLDKELTFHVEQHAADLMARGHTPQQARRLARLSIGGPEQVKEQCRDARGTRWLEDFAQDFRYSLRTLRQKPGFAAAALLTLALGSGATTVMFTVVNSVLLKPLAYPEAGRLLSLHEQVKPDYLDWSFAYLNFLDCQQASQSMSLAAWRNGSGTLSEPGGAEFVPGRQVSASLFSVLGIRLHRGRAFLPDEDRPGGAPVAVISYRLWQDRFGYADSAIGGRVILDGTPYTVVGIAPAGFKLSGDVDVFTPMGQNTAPTMRNRDMHPGIQVIGRLRAGATMAGAQAEAGLIGRRLAAQYPKENAGRNIGVMPLRQQVVGDVRPMLWLLLGAVGMVLLIACANVASLLLARAVSRERELAMRVALGAGRGRLARQCLTEGAVLALGGGVLGLGLAALGIRPFLAFWPGGLPRAEEVRLDWRVLLFALAAAGVCGLLFGLAPALRAPARALERVLRAGARTVSGSSRRWHSGFVMAEIALAVVLLIAAAMLGRTLLRLSSLDPGMDTRNVLLARVALSAEAVASPARMRVAWREILDRLEQTPGVAVASVSDLIPMAGDDEQIGYWTSSVPPPVNQMTMTLMSLVTPGYRAAMGIPLREGRFFTEADRQGAETVIVIDDVMERRVFGGHGGAVGKHLSLQFVGSARIVGVVGHVRHWGLDADDQAAIREQVYLPFAWLPDEYLRMTGSAMTLVVRTTVPPANLVDAVRRQVRGSARDQAIHEVRTMEQVVHATLARQRFLLLLFAIFAGLALLLASIGIYGVLAYLTAQRVPEIGVRMALGARTSDVLWMVLRQSLGMIVLGACIGLGASLAAGRLLAHLVNGMRPVEAGTVAFVLAVLMLSALIASYLPARRASRIDPLSALRQD